MVIQFQIIHRGTHPITHIIRPAAGSNGITSHKINVNAPNNNWNNITSSPDIITPVRTNEPMIRDINLSKNACILTPIKPSIWPAEICLYGEKRVFKSNPTEKKSAEVHSLSLTILRRTSNPLPYHQDNIPTKNM